MNKETGGPAFPQQYQTCKPHMTGMALRDYFAAKAMQTLISMSHEELQELSGEYDEITTQGLIVNTAYEIADAMLEARK